MFAPIVLFTYSRVDHTKRVVESLLTNNEAKDSELFIFSDGAKDESKECAVNENRRYIHTIAGFKSVTIIEREKNYGLANSLIAGITDVIGKYGKVIVVEDDLVVSPYFLKFMNDGLRKYENEERVGAISAFIYPVNKKLPTNFFLRYFNCWGWAIWKRSWDLLNTDTKYLLRKMRFLSKEFDVGGGAGAYGNLYCQKVGLVDSWWVRLYASLFLANKLTLYPGQSLTTNEGLDGSGTHCVETSDIISKVVPVQSPIKILDIDIEENRDAFKIYSCYFNSLNKAGRIRQMFYSAWSFVRRLLYIDCR